MKSETNTSTTTSTENTTSVTPKNDTPKNTETTTSNKTDNVPAPCVPTYTTVNHPEQGHYETRVVKEAEYLLSTGNREIVEASPVDNIWGIGFSSDNAMENVDKWGQNLLGKTLMKVRTILK